jgi:replicative DNA helicase
MTDARRTKKENIKFNGPDLSTMVYGKVPPQAKDIEEAVLGAILLEKDAFDNVADILRPECFYVESHQRIFKSMRSLAQKSQPIDILTISEELRNTDELDLVGGSFYVTKLTSSVVSSANIDRHARIIYQKFMQREMIRISGEIIGQAYEDACEPIELMNEWEKQVTDLSMARIFRKQNSFDGMLVQRVQRIEELRHKPSRLTGISSGFQAIDRITHGWQNTDLIILAARPSVGKTAFALNLARHAAKDALVAFFSLEMSYGQLVDRYLSSESEIWLDRISNGDIDEAGMVQLYQKGVQPLSKVHLYIDDTPGINVFELRAACRKLKRKDNLGMVIIDYLQLMSGTGERRNSNREQEISEISRNLKTLAKELEVPVMALSQLSREPEKRRGEKKTPLLSDLRESGAIEQDADLVMFMYRPEYYDEASNEMGETTKGETHILISKHRNGRLAKGPDVIKLRADLAIQKFYDWDALQDLKPFLGKGSWRPVTNEEKGEDLPF